MARFRDIKALPQCTAVHTSIHHHVTHQRQLPRRDIFGSIRVSQRYFGAFRGFS